MIRKLLLGVTFIFIAGWWQISVAHTKAEVANEIKAVKAATAKYQDVNVALAEGFIPDPSGHCISAAAEGLPPEWGAMGIHYLNMAKLKITAAEPRVDGDGTHTDFMAPGVLLYEPQADGSLKLVGVENLVFQKAWKSAGHNKPPTFAGRTWDAMADNAETVIDEAHLFEPHFDQHVWAFRDNPNGALVPFNPNVTCEHHKMG
jgi:hypothetical protein